MKKLALVLLAGFSLVATANAQTFAFGVKAGANFANVSGSGVSGTNTLIGFNGGVFFHLPLAHGLSLQPELSYSGEGFKQSVSGTDITIAENYLTIPVLLKYRFPMGLFIETGPQVGFLLSAKGKSGGTSVDEKQYFNSSDFDWAVGAGFHIPTTHLAVDARYAFGLSNIANDNASTGSTGTVKNGVFQIDLMYTLFSAPGR